MTHIEFYRHNISEQDIKNIAKVLKGIFLSTGKNVADFENSFAGYLGCKYAVGTTSCTASMHLALEAFGVGLGDEVITTPLTFVATSNAILHTGADPVFVDVEEETGNINADLIERAITKKTKAILPVHLYGQMADMKKIRKIADKHKLKVIEDAAHCMEGARDGARVGQLSDAACFSFYATKNITCGEGGAISLNNEKTASLLKKTRLHGLEQSAYERYEKKFTHSDMAFYGWKYNMNNIQASLLAGQLSRIEKLWRRREEICKRYTKAFQNVPGINLPKTLDGVKHARHLFTIWVDSGKRSQIREELQKRGVANVVNYWPAVHLMTYYRKRYGYKPGDFPVAEAISEKTITLPFYPKLTNKEVDFIIANVLDVIKL
ncbi:MAG: DegT/DnrJ/EryC1/StrS family aminotransferase [Candidatus Nealsonbacteria bacterium]|nr:DegT/DnrJ/EryC1/StrS family aminotransferase [Candidatus Nealsonbacteria bacterium]